MLVLYNAAGEEAGLCNYCPAQPKSSLLSKACERLDTASRWTDRSSVLAVSGCWRTHCCRRDLQMSCNLSLSSSLSIGAGAEQPLKSPACISAPLPSGDRRSAITDFTGGLQVFTHHCIKVSLDLQLKAWGREQRRSCGWVFFAFRSELTNLLAF